MAAILNELKSNLLSNIVFLGLLLYHNRFNQSSHISALNHEIPGTIPSHQIKKSGIRKIIIKELHFTFKNSLSFLLPDRLSIFEYGIEISIIRYIFGLSYFFVLLIDFIAWGQAGMTSVTPVFSVAKKIMVVKRMSREDTRRYANDNPHFCPCITMDQLLVFFVKIYAAVIPGAQISAPKNGPLGPCWAAGAARFVAKIRGNFVTGQVQRNFSFRTMIGRIKGLP